MVRAGSCAQHRAKARPKKERGPKPGEGLREQPVAANPERSAEQKGEEDASGRVQGVFGIARGHSYINCDCDLIIGKADDGVQVAEWRIDDPLSGHGRVLEQGARQRVALRGCRCLRLRPYVRSTTGPFVQTAVCNVRDFVAGIPFACVCAVTCWRSKR
jgi:hypothetical protein